MQIASWKGRVKDSMWVKFGWVWVDKKEVPPLREAPLFLKVGSLLPNLHLSHQPAPGSVLHFCPRSRFLSLASLLTSGAFRPQIVLRAHDSVGAIASVIGRAAFVVFGWAELRGAKLGLRRFVVAEGFVRPHLRLPFVVARSASQIV